MIAELEKPAYFAPKFLTMDNRAEYLRQLLKSDFFQVKGFALAMFPGKDAKAAGAALDNKLEGRQNRKLSEEEEEKLIAELHKLADEINQLFPRGQQEPQATEAGPAPVAPTKKLSNIFGAKREGGEK